jgi:long-chain fatty acid transport protein
MRRLSLSLGVVLLFAVAAGPALGSGFAVYQQGAKATAQAGAFTARANDPSAVFYNPAGITQLEGTQFYLGANMMLLGNGDFRPFGSGQKRSDQRGSLDVTPTVYLTHKLSDTVSFGIGLNSPFWLDTDWDSNFEGRYLARQTKLLTGAVNPTFAFALDDHWSLAFGAEYVYADIKLTRNLDFSAVGDPDGFARLDDDSDGLGGNFALHYRSDTGAYWGIAWKSQVVIDFDDADVTFEDTSSAADAAFCGGSPCFPDQKAAGGFRLPQRIAMGVGTVTEKWALEVDVVWHDWELFEGFNFEFEENTALLSDESSPSGWDSTFSYRVGGAWRLTDRYELRAGLYYDDSPVPDQTLGPQVPDAAATSAQIGYGYNSESGRFRFDAFWEYIRRSDNSTLSQEDGLNGRYTGSTNILGFAATWICGKKG